MNIPHETTPGQITQEIEAFCTRISSINEPVYVPVFPQHGCVKGECYSNVNSVISKSGGNIILGWAIWRWANILIEAEAHAVLETIDGKLVDVTPDESNQILFLKDPNLSYSGCPINSIRCALTESPLVTELIELMDFRDSLITIKGSNEILLTDEVRLKLIRLHEIQQILQQPVMSINNLCQCGSGAKYKKCCGKYR